MGNGTGVESSGDEEEIVFARALLLTDPAECDAFLDRACAGKPAMRQRVAEMLASHDSARNFFEAGAAAFAESGASPGEDIGQRLGRYFLREKIGEGGCGTVYLAEQSEPVRRRVALKVLKLGMETRSVAARFEAERQALALMDHPAIAKVLDGGTTSHGRPFFVMELVRGMRVTEFCDHHCLSVGARLELFVLICEGVQHAHQKGIIHRDLKPSNILVTLHDDIAAPKIIDFGIAKAVQGRLTDQTICTQLHEFIGTPAYMSPEQAGMGGLDIDTRSDIYSLGVLLYELLTGATPFDPTELLARGLDEIRRTIREQEFVRPSTRLGSLAPLELAVLARRRQVGPAHLAQRLRGDLDSIVMKCLEKERTRRYDTANGLAKDVQRHLAGEPVVARPASKLYRFRKFVRRNKLAVGAAAAVMAALILGFGLSTAMFLREREARKLAIAAELRERHFRQEAELRELNLLAFQRLAEGKLAEAEAARRQVLERQEKLLSRRHPEVAASLEALSQVLLKQGKLAQAESAFREALQIRRDLPGQEPEAIAESIRRGADVLESQGRLTEAEALHREALAVQPSGHLEAAESLHKLGLVLYKQGQQRFPEAERVLREALLIRRSQLGPDDRTALSFQALGLVLRAQGKLADAALLYRDALPEHLTSWPNDPEPELKALGDGLLRERQFREADDLLNDIVPAPGTNLPYTPEILRLRGNFRARLGQFREAAADYMRAIELAPDRVHDWHCLAVLLVESSQFDAYHQHCRKALERFRSTTNPNAAEQIARDSLLLPELRIDLSVAGQLVNFAVSATNHEHIAWFEVAKALVEYRQAHFQEAIAWAEKVLARGGGLSERQALAEVVRGMAQHRLQRTGEARDSLASARRRLEAHETAMDPGDLGHNWASWLVVRALLREASAFPEE